MEKPKTVEIFLGENGEEALEVCPLTITDFRMMAGGETLEISLPEEFEGIEVAVMLVTKPPQS